MKRRKNKRAAHFVLGLAVLGLLTPGLCAATERYTVSTDALAITPTHALFTLKFDFVSSNTERYRIPVGARYGNPAATSPYVGFSLSPRDGAVAPTPVRATGIVLSSAQTEDGHYTIPEDSRESFRLIALIEVPADIAPATYDLELTHLPYRAGTSMKKVSDDRLARFTAGPVLLNGPLMRITDVQIVPRTEPNLEQTR